MKTWYHFLPEVGRQITVEADRIASKQSEIDALRAQINMLSHEKDEINGLLECEVKKHWTDKEIHEAKHQINISEFAK